MIQRELSEMTLLLVAGGGGAREQEGEGRGALLSGEISTFPTRRKLITGVYVY